MPKQKLWPVTFRPKKGEVLYSWLARMAPCMVFHLVNSRVRSLMQTCPERSGWDQLLSCLSANNIADLERRSWRWPPAAHNSPLRSTIHCPLARTCFFSRYRKIDTPSECLYRIRFFLLIVSILARSFPVATVSCKTNIPGGDLQMDAGLDRNAGDQISSCLSR
jgi:hypothetical protein